MLVLDLDFPVRLIYKCLGCGASLVGFSSEGVYG